MNFRQLPAFAMILAVAIAPLAHASTTKPTSSSYLVTHKAEVAATPAQVYAALGQPDKWWNPEHTHSGKASNLKMDMRAGGCFCESWDAGSVEHLHVIQALRDQLLRLEGGLGPLQEKAVTGILTFAMAPSGGKTQLVVTYRVRAAEANLDASSDMVDQVVGEQVTRLVSFVEKK